MCHFEKKSTCGKTPNILCTLIQHEQNEKVFETQCTRTSRHTHKHPLCSLTRPRGKQLKQKPSCSRRKSEERVRLDKNTEMGEDWDQRAFLCLYYTPSVLCYSFVLTSAERGLTKKEEREREGEAQQGIAGHKRFTSPCPETSFSRKNNTASSKRNGVRKAGPGRRGGRETEVED